MTTTEGPPARQPHRQHRQQPLWRTASASPSSRSDAAGLGHVELCDFCSSRPVCWIASCEPFDIPQVVAPHLHETSLGDWAACQTCGELILAGKKSRFLQRCHDAVDHDPDLRATREAADADTPYVRRQVRRPREELHRRFWRHFQGGATAVKPRPFGHENKRKNPTARRQMTMTTKPKPIAHGKVLVVTFMCWRYRGTLSTGAKVGTEISAPPQPWIRRNVSAYKVRHHGNAVRIEVEYSDGRKPEQFPPVRRPYERDHYRIIAIHQDVVLDEAASTEAAQQTVQPSAVPTVAKTPPSVAVAESRLIH